MPKFYYTYGTGTNMPYYGGWSEITADDRSSADKLFRMLHPDQNGTDCLNCSFVYPEEDFKNTKMYKDGSNFGAACHETVSLSVKLEERTKDRYLLTGTFSDVEAHCIKDSDVMFTAHADPDTYMKLCANSQTGFDKLDRISHLDISFFADGTGAVVSIITKDGHVIDIDMYRTETLFIANSIAQMIRNGKILTSKDPRYETVTSVLKKYVA